MLLVNRLITHSRHTANNDGHRSPGTIRVWCFGGSLVSTILFVATSTASADQHKGLHPAELAMQADKQAVGDHWWQIDVDPKFAVDGRPFLIEPAAGPLYEDERQNCRHVPVEELACSDER